VWSLLFLATACGGGSSASLQAASVAGNWQMTLTSSNKMVSPKKQSGFLLQSDTTVTGGLIYTSPPCSGVGSVTGTISGTTVDFAVGVTGLTVNLTGALGSDMASMSGDYTILSSGCQETGSNPQDTGTWTASLVKPLSGNLQGAFTSKGLNNANLQVTGKINQGQNTGNSDTAVGGSMSISGYCFTTANISGVVSGTSVVMDLLNPDGTEIGQVSGTSTTDGTSINGTYIILSQGPTGVAPCTKGDSGTVKLTL
jgi:hypothetical protein